MSATLPKANNQPYFVVTKPMRAFYLTMIATFGMLTGFTPLVWAQEEISWETLSDITYDYIQNEEQNFWYGEPTFGTEVQALDGQRVVIQGYILPVDFSGNSYFLSAFPYSSCFFCGGAGQESIMELQLKNKKKTFKMDEVVTLTGTLRLNDRELELNYILEDARIYAP
ncbi:MAG: DUF3299 domain-containing protein [Bacteroidota bacterium]